MQTVQWRIGTFGTAMICKFTIHTHVMILLLSKQKSNNGSIELIKYSLLTKITEARVQVCAIKVQFFSFLHARLLKMVTCYGVQR